MATLLHVSVLIPWLTLTLVSTCRGDVRDIVTQDIFDKILYGDITSSPVVVGEIATQDFFDDILSGATDDNCTGKNFYTYSDFIDATRGFSEFGTSGNSADHKRELAAFFAIVADVTSDLCYVEAIGKSKNCDSSYTQYPCTNGKQYYGRGPIQLAWNYNYGAAGNYLGINLLKNPEIVSRDDLTAWKTALWFWNVRSNCHIAITSGQGFAATINAASGGNCSGGNSNAVNLYTNYCSQLGVDPGSNLSC